MINSTLLLGSSLNKNKHISKIIYLILLLNIIIVQFNKVELSYFISNIIIITLITLLIRKIKNKYFNNLMSILSIIIWSILIDIICYYLFPMFNGHLNIFEYILNGINFNLKYVGYNTVIVITMYTIEYSYKKVKKLINDKKKVLINNQY